MHQFGQNWSIGCWDMRFDLILGASHWNQYIRYMEVRQRSGSTSLILNVKSQYGKEAWALNFFKILHILTDIYGIKENLELQLINTINKELFLIKNLQEILLS